jgi:hypothetical protein
LESPNEPRLTYNCKSNGADPDKIRYAKFFGKIMTKGDPGEHLRDICSIRRSID